jgi:ankyrin repeat protein
MSSLELLAKAEAGDTGAVDRLLAGDASPDQSGPGGETPLMRAAARGHVEIVQRLLAKGAKVDAVTDVGNTALMFAAARGRVEMLRLLMTSGARADHRNKYGLGPADWAKWSEREAEVIALLGVEPRA